MKGVRGKFWEAHRTGEAYDADGWLRTRGRKAITQKVIDEAYVIYRAKRLGMGLGYCTVLVNEFMRPNGRGDGVSYGAVQKFMAGCVALATGVTARGSPACGSARARLSPSRTTQTSRRPTGPLQARLLPARASRMRGWGVSCP